MNKVWYNTNLLLQNLLWKVLLFYPFGRGGSRHSLTLLALCGMQLSCQREENSLSLWQFFCGTWKSTEPDFLNNPSIPLELSVSIICWLWPHAIFLSNGRKSLTKGCPIEGYMLYLRCIYLTQEWAVTFSSVSMSHSLDQLLKALSWNLSPDTCCTDLSPLQS